MAAHLIMSDLVGNVFAEIALWLSIWAAIAKLAWNLSKMRSDIDANARGVEAANTKIDKGREEDMARMERDFQELRDMMKEMRDRSEANHKQVMDILIQRGQ